MDDYRKYKAIGILDVNREEKRRRKLLTFDILPIWRWFWCQLKHIHLDAGFIDVCVDEPAEKVFEQYDFILVYIDHYVPKWLPEVLDGLVLCDTPKTVAFCGYLPTIEPEKTENIFHGRNIILHGPLEVVLSQLCNEFYAAAEDGTNKIYMNPFPKQPKISEQYFLEYKETFLGSSVGIIQSSSGCPRKCSFCRYSEFYHTYDPEIYQQYSVDEVVAEIKRMIEDYDIKYFRMVDSNFLGSGRLIYERALEFSEKVKENNLNMVFAIHCRSDAVSKEVIALLHSAGLRYVTMGIESMSDEQLKRFGKQETVEDHWKAVKLLKELKLNVQGYAILADPLMTRSNLIENLQGLCELSKHIQIVINERMILYTTTGYLKKYKDDICGIKSIESSLGVIEEYEFTDAWCKQYFSLLEETSRWIQNRIAQMYGERKEAKIKTNGDYMQKATVYRLQALLKIAKMDFPDDNLIENVKQHAIERINNMR